MDDEQRSLVAQIDARIEALTRTEAESVRRSIQASITRLESQSEGERQEGPYVEREIAEVNTLANNPAAYEAYRKAIGAGLLELEKDGKAGRKTTDLIAGLALTRDHIRIALSSDDRRALGSTLPVLAPASRQKANHRAPALIKDRLPLPRRFLLSDPAGLASLHDGAGLSVVQIARRLGVSNAGVVAALRRLGICRVWGHHRGDRRPRVGSRRRGGGDGWRSALAEWSPRCHSDMNA
jgi:hypothetical protein